MTQVTPRYEQTLFRTSKSKGFPRTFDPSCSKAANLHCILDSKQHSKVELVLLQGKKHDAHLSDLLGTKLSPYFRRCVSQELLTAKLCTNEKLPSLCFSCNRTLDRRLEKTISFNRIKLKRRAFPSLKDNKDEDKAEQLTAAPWKYSREQQCMYHTETSVTPFQLFEKAQTLMEYNKQCLGHTPSLIFIRPDVIKITPKKKITSKPKDSRLMTRSVGLAPPPTPIYITDHLQLSPDARNL